MTFDQLALLFALAAYSTYALATFGRIPWPWFDWANVIVGPILCSAALLAGTLAGAFLPAAFAVTGAASIVNRWRKRRQSAEIARRIFEQWSK